MRAIDILFNEIDNLNTEIKKEEDIRDKILLVHQIKKIIEIINNIYELRIQSGNDNWI